MRQMGYTTPEMIEQLKKMLGQKRFEHSLSVMGEAKRLAGIHGVDTEKAAVAGLLHDCMMDVEGKDVLLACEKYNVEVSEIERRQPELLHGALGAKAVKEIFGVSDAEIAEAIRRHTTGGAGICNLALAKVVFVADYIEPGRRMEGVKQIRAEADRDLDSAMLLILENTIYYIIGKKAFIHPDSIDARNEILMRLSGKE